MLRTCLESHTRAPPYWHLAHTPPDVPSLSSAVCWLACCGLAAPLSTSTAERTAFQGFGTLVTTSTARAGLSSSSAAVSPSSTQRPIVKPEMMQLLPASSQIRYRDSDCAHRVQWPTLNPQWHPVCRPRSQPWPALDLSLAPELLRRPGL